MAFLCRPHVALQACRHFNDSGVCKENCPPPTIYDTVSFQTKPNPDKKFSFGATCIKTCPCEISRKFLLLPLPPTPPQCWATIMSLWSVIHLKILHNILSLTTQIFWLLFFYFIYLFHILSTKFFYLIPADNYLAMDVACMRSCPKANQEVIIRPPGGNETQKCEKCEGDCPKGGRHFSL